MQRSLRLAEDVHIARKYGLDNFISARRECKAALQKKLGLVITPNAVVFGFVGRLTWQKGLGLSDGSEEGHLLTPRVKSGSPERFHCQAGSDTPLRSVTPDFVRRTTLHRMAAALYGAVVIATATGGLKDCVKGIEEQDATGFLIHPPVTEFGVRQALREASALYFHNPGRFQKLGQTILHGIRRRFASTHFTALFPNA
ncbi:unnamed protein product [Durusdinium trenchii]|uniref:Uncharacterized protein n=1 Tax=Durusdinium trenchii TaxID=1381693 RepID=A0ABP0M2X1_9DINO